MQKLLDIYEAKYNEFPGWIDCRILMTFSDEKPPEEHWYSYVPGDEAEIALQIADWLAERPEFPIAPYVPPEE